MTEQEAIISHIEECKHRIETVQNYMKDNRDANLKRCKRSIFILENVIKALEKQIAKKPDVEGDGYADGHIVYDTWICPNCENHYEIDYDNYDYCPNCGQKILLDLGDEDAE